MNASIPNYMKKYASAALAAATIPSTWNEIAEAAMPGYHSFIDCNTVREVMNYLIAVGLLKQSGLRDDKWYLYVAA